MAALSEKVLRQFAVEDSVIITAGSGLCPVFARGDRRTVATHWLARGTVRALEDDGVLTPVPRGLILSKTLRFHLLNPDPTFERIL